MQYQKINDTTYQKSCGLVTTTIYASSRVILKTIKGNGKEYNYAVTQKVIKRKIVCNSTKEVIEDFIENRLIKNFEYYLDRFTNKDSRNRLSC